MAAALATCMTNSFASIELEALHAVTGGADKPTTPPTKQPTQPVQHPQPTQTPTQTQPHGNSDTQWISNTVRCARIGGPVLGAICGILTPTPAY